MTPPSGYNLVFSDEFDGTSVDSNKWNIKNNWKPSNSPVCMLGENVYISDSNLIIKSRNDGGGPCGLQRSSGYVDTKGKFSGTYYYAEMKAKLPKGKGIWPAFWMLPGGGGWPPEIDIFEMLGHQPSKLYMTTHMPGCNDPNCGGYSCCKSGSYVGSDFSSDYHIFGMEWTSSYVVWFVDGVERFRSTQYVPQQSMFLVIDTYVGGDWPGNPDNTTQFPQYFYTDYVRVYQKGAPSTKYRCSGTPDFQCIEDVNGPFDSLAACQAACKVPITKYRCTGSPDFQCVEDVNGPFDSLAACQAACKQPSSLKEFNVYIIGFNGVVVMKSSKGNYTEDEACKFTCKILKDMS